MPLTAEDVLLGLREQGYVPTLKHRQAVKLAAEFGASYKPEFWAPTVSLSEIAALIATHINSLEAPK